MIASRRVVLAAHEGFFAHGLTEWMAGDEGPDAIAASRIVAETFIMWRRVLLDKFKEG